MKNKLQFSNGQTCTLSEMYPGKKILLYFYPKDMTSGCTTQAKDLRDHHQLFIDKEIEVVGVSRDGIESHRKFIKMHDLPFLLVSDESLALCQHFNVWVEKSMYGKKYMGIERSTFLLDEAGEVLMTWRKVRPAKHMSDIVKAITDA